MRAKRQPPQLFSFSFLDILACTVGAVLFVLMVQALQLAVAAPLPTESLEGLRAERAALTSEIAADARSLAEQEAEVERLGEELKSLEASARAARKRVARAEKALPKRKVVDLAPIRPRVSKHTKKQWGFAIDCRPTSVDVVELKATPIVGPPPGKKVEMTVLGSTPPSRLRGVATPLGRELSQLDADRHYVFVFLRPGAVKTFRKLRSVIKDHGLEIAWKPLEGEERVFYMAGGAGSQGARTD